MRKRLPGLKFTVVRAPTVSDRAIKDGLPPGLPVDVVPPDKRYLSMRESALAVAASGTVALEAALLQTPTIVAYRLSPLTFLLGRLLVRVPHISLPNLILDERLFPELLQGGAEGGNIARHALAWLDNPDEMSRVRQRLADLADMIGEPGAPRRAAEIILARIAAGADENTP
jgi:lipid-A-disaccharide synthase